MDLLLEDNPLVEGDHKVVLCLRMGQVGSPDGMGHHNVLLVVGSHQLVGHGASVEIHTPFYDPPHNSRHDVEDFYRDSLHLRDEGCSHHVADHDDHIHHTVVSLVILTDICGFEGYQVESRINQQAIPEFKG